jgi:hypothetical protein
MIVGNMIEKIETLPPGTVGFRASGKLTRRDYREVFEPGLRAAAESGSIRMLFELTDFKGLEPAAWWEDLRTGVGLGLGHRSAWKKSAVVTDVEWVAKALQLFEWMVPGELRIYGLQARDEAVTWVSS